MFYQFDVKDAMEESISGGRKDKNIRPTINSYMYANAKSLARMAELLGDANTQKIFTDKANFLRKAVEDTLWDSKASFLR
jgi:neutral trehalase